MVVVVVVVVVVVAGGGARVRHEQGRSLSASHRFPIPSFFTVHIPDFWPRAAHFGANGLFSSPLPVNLI